MKTITVPDDVFAKIEPIVAGMTLDLETHTVPTEDELVEAVLTMMDQFKKANDMQDYMTDMMDVGIESWTPVERIGLVRLFKDMVKYQQNR